MRTLAATLLLVLAAGCGGSGREAAPAKVGAEVQQLVRAGAPGVVLFVRNGSHSYDVAAGLADRADKRAMGAGDSFRIGSITKSYVAAVVLELVGEKKLALGASVERYLPGLVPNGERITIRELLDHTSGLFDYTNDARFTKPYLSGRLGVTRGPRRLVAYATSHPPLFTPGAKFSYSNTNYVVLGLVVEHVTGHPLGEELSSRVFKPLHLDDTRFPVAATPLPDAHGYYAFGTGAPKDVTVLTPSFGWAAGAIVATAADVADFYQALLAGKLLEPALLARMLTTVPLPGSASGGYGLGLTRYPTPCGSAWGHDGNFPGYFALALASPDGSRQAVLLVNEDPTALPAQAQRLLGPLLARAYCRS